MPWQTGNTRTSEAAHKRWARAVMRAAKGRCEIQGPRCTGVAVHADHKLAVAEGGAEYDLENGQGACGQCHDDKTRRETQRGRQRYYGAAKRPRQRHPGLP